MWAGRRLVSQAIQIPSASSVKTNNRATGDIPPSSDIIPSFSHPPPPAVPSAGPALTFVQLVKSDFWNVNIVNWMSNRSPQGRFATFSTNKSCSKTRVYEYVCKYCAVRIICIAIENSLGQYVYANQSWINNVWVLIRTDWSVLSPRLRSSSHFCGASFSPELVLSAGPPLYMEN